MTIIKSGTLKIPGVKLQTPWEFEDTQEVTLGRRTYNVHECIRLSEKLPVEWVIIRHMGIDYSCPCNGTLRSFAEHMLMVQRADLNVPILLNEWGQIIDGRHRLIAALVKGEEGIKAKRFDTDPDSGWEIKSNE